MATDGNHGNQATVVTKYWGSGDQKNQALQKFKPISHIENNSSTCTTNKIYWAPSN